MGIRLDRTATGIVFSGLRKYADAIRRNLAAYHLDATRSEELEEAIRFTRTMRSATSLIGSFALNRIVSLQEEILHSATTKTCTLEDEALGVLRTMLDAIDSYTTRIESRFDASSATLPDDHQELSAAVRAFRRYRDLPEDEDDQAISSLFSTSGIVTGVDGDRGEDESLTEASAKRHVVPADAGHEESSNPLERDRSDQGTIPPKLLDTFQVEADDHIDRIYRALRQIEDEHDNRDLVQEIRRAAHTLKGAGAAVGLTAVKQLSHRMEDLLDALYEGSVELSPDVLDLLAATTDMLHDLSTGKAAANQQQCRMEEIYSAYDRYCQSNLGRSTSGDTTIGHASSEDDSAALGAEHGCEDAREPQGSCAQENKPARRQSALLRVPASRLDGLRGTVGELMINRNAMQQGVVQLTHSVTELQPALDRLRDICHDMENHRSGSDSLRIANNCPSVIDQELPAPGNVVEIDESGISRITRVHDWSQSLTEATGLIASIGIALSALLNESESLLAQQGRLIQDTRERLVQIQRVQLGTIIPRLDRALREVASSNGKSVELVVEGEEIELDKIMLEEMVEPLLHLIRNAVDHGIELPDERLAKGKPAQGSVHISLLHYATQIVMHVRDDGKGLDVAKIRAAAVEGGYVAAEKSEALTPQELYRHIFVPGFSTASSVSEISGRGVGMDVVRKKIEELKGRIDIDSVLDRGVSFTIRLPVGLAVTRALIVIADHQQFAIPQSAVSSVIRSARSDLKDDADGQTLCVGDSELPLVCLRDYLGLEHPNDPPPDPCLVVLIQSGTQRAALQVDGILPGREIVVKPLGSDLASAPGLLGATILGNGAVLPILDPTDLLAYMDTQGPRAPAA